LGEQCHCRTALLKYGFHQYNKDLEFINALDPRFSFPITGRGLYCEYRYPTRNAAITIGERGVREATLMAGLILSSSDALPSLRGDHVNAAKYFDLAARDPKRPFI